MKHLRLKTISDNYFIEAWKLYEKSFPIKERRSIDSQVKVMQQPNYHFDIMTNNKQLIGFLLWWDFETHRYTDHFATITQQRNKGFGTLIIEKFMATNDKSILLEVELPNSVINQRRIKFYERIGFNLNQHYYEIPPIEEGQQPLQLLLMSHPNFLTVTDVEQFVKTCHPVIFKD